MKLLGFLVSTLVSCSAFANTKIAMIQYDADLHFGDTAYNLAQLKTLVEEAVLNGAKFIVLPEGSAHGYASPTLRERKMWCLSADDRRCRDVREVAEKIGAAGGVVAYWKKFAKLNGIHVVTSVIEEERGKFYNSAVTIGPKGVASVYRKRELYVTNQYYATSGKEPVVADFGFGKVGFLICMDANYDELFQEYKGLGVNTLVITMDWDQSPDRSSPRSAANFFASKARQHRMTILASDVSRWDGTALYLPSGERVRDGMQDPAVGVNGITYGYLP